MALKSEDILIVGCGPGAPGYLSPAAKTAVASADVLLGAQRLLDMFPKFPGQTIPWQGHTDDLLAEVAKILDCGQSPAVLVSGDPGLFSLAQGLVRRFGVSRCHIVPAVSSVQVAFARLGLAWVDAKIISAHGRSPDVAPAELAGHDKIAILAGTAEALAFCGMAAQALQQTHAAVVCENLTLSDERIRRMEAEKIASCGASSLTIIILARKELFE